MSSVLPRLLGPLRQFIDSITLEFDQIPAERKVQLGHLTAYVQARLDAHEPILLTFICTHNSRRSHLAQLWAQTAAYPYRIPEVRTYSGGMEATAFNPRAVRAVAEVGFRVERTNEGANPIYQVWYATDAVPVKAFSKVYDGGGNPTADFAAVMTCTDAEENCPFIPGAIRLSLPYPDPKAFDDTLQEAAQYRARTRQIGRELLYAFSLINLP